MEYVQGDRHAAAAPASDGFPDFGSLDGLEAAIGRAELAAADPGRDRGRQRAINHGLLPASSARGLQFMASRPAHQSARGPGVMAANAAAQPSSRRTVDSLAELARVQQRHTRKLKNILQLLKPKRDNPMDAASNSPFDFLP
jgi:hypothetical protein